MRGLVLNPSSLCFLFLTVLPVVWAATQTCYYPNGAIASDQVPCSDGEYSSCCNRNAICLSNNLCMGIKQPFTLGRGACTDPDWQSDKCPQYCQTAQPAGGCSIILLNSTGGVNSYCCNSLVLASGHDQPVCDVGSPFIITDATPIAGRGALSAMVQTDPTTSTSSTSTTTSPTSSSTSSGASSSTGVPQACSSSNGTAPVQDQLQPYRDAAIGAGVGVPLGVIAIGFLIWALWERRNRKRIQQGLNGAPTGMDSAMKHSAVDSGSWQTSSPPPSFYRRQSRPTEMLHGREPAELH